jgi:hypothetical protein
VLGEGIPKLWSTDPWLKAIIIVVPAAYFVTSLQPGCPTMILRILCPITKSWSGNRSETLPDTSVSPTVELHFP